MISIPWWEYAVLGASGGVISEILAVLEEVQVWRDSRRKVAGAIRKNPDKLIHYIDFHVHIVMVFLGIVIGASAAALFGLADQALMKALQVLFAVASGVAGPRLLLNLRNVRLIHSVLEEFFGLQKSEENDLSYRRLVQQLEEVVDEYKEKDGSS